MTKYLLTVTLCFALNAANAQLFKVDTLLYHDVVAERIDFVILGDGYLESQQEDFLDDARSMVADIFNAAPFNQYVKYFNVFTISVPSNVQGAASDPEQLIDNYFGSTFNSSGIQRLLVPTRYDKIFDVLANNFPTYNQVMMIVNSEVYGGSGGTVATASVNSLASEIAIHELGHSFAGLADEYWAGEQYAWEAANMTQESKPGRIRWSNWLNDAGIGIFPVGPSRWYKPYDNCKMEVLGQPFCAVCTEQIIWTIHTATSPVGTYETNTGTETISFSLTLIEPDPNTMKIRWLKNDVEFDRNVAATQVRLGDLATGLDTIEAIMYDSTALDRRNTIFITSVKWFIETATTVDIQKFEDARPGLIVTKVKDETSGMRISVFPNPSNDLLIVEYDLPTASQTELSILNAEGKRIFNVVKDAEIHGNTQMIDISSFSNGLYILKFKSGTFNQSLRIVKSD